jgi:ATP-dependent DNA ligase
MPIPSSVHAPLSVHPVPKALREQEPARTWQAEWNWGGIPAWIQVDDDAVDFRHLPTGERLNDRFPDLAAQASGLLPGILLEGHLLGWRDEQPDPDSGDMIFMATDLLTFQDISLDTMPLYARMQQLLPIVGSADLPGFRCSEPLPLAHWPDLDRLLECAPAGVDGVILRRLHDTREGERFWVRA